MRNQYVPMSDAAQSHYEGASACMLDIVIFAGGESFDLMPLCAFEPKCMLRVCNRPLIWFCLAPWIEAGFRTFFLCVNEDYATLHTYLSHQFHDVEFHFVLVPLTLNDHASTTCDAVKAYLKYKELMQRAGEDGYMVKETGATEAAREGNNSEQILANNDTLGGFPGFNAYISTPGSNRDPLTTESAAFRAMRRDAVLLNCDTILAGVDIERLVTSFYSSMASVMALFFKPYVEPASPAPAREKVKPKKNTSVKAEPARKGFTYQYCCVAYEEDSGILTTEVSGDLGDSERSGFRKSFELLTLSTAQTSAAFIAPYRSPNATALSATASVPVCDEVVTTRHRLYYIYPLDDNPQLRITMGFAARRPNLTFTANIVDANVYIVRQWVLDFIAQSAGIPDESVGKTIIPLLARNQHTTINSNENVFHTPDKKIGFPIPIHWMFRKSARAMDVQLLNAIPDLFLLEKTDNLRVFCTIIEEEPNAASKIYRINTRDNFQAISQEIIAAKCQATRVLNEANSQPSWSIFPQSRVGLGTENPSRHDAFVNTSPTPLARKRVNNCDTFPTLPLTYPGNVIALLLPTNPFTLKESIGGQQIHIVDSFVESVPSANTFITRSVIGPNVTIGEGARITDSIILSNVEIGPRTVIVNSVIGTSAVVSPAKRITNSVVAPRCYVEEDQSDRIVGHEN